VEWVMSEDSELPTWSPPTVALVQAQNGTRGSKLAEAGGQQLSLGDYFQVVED